MKNFYHFKLINFVLIFILTSLLGYTKSTVESSIVLTNNFITKTILASKTKPSAINIQLTDQLNETVAYTNENYPLFEFVINNQLIKASDPYWVLASHNTRKMGNNGTEHTLVFNGASEPVNGLQVTLYQQLFPNSTAIREKLVLQKTNDETFTLNKLENQLHFKFPQYAVNSSADAKSTEIRIATWEKKQITFQEEGKNKYNHMYYPEINETTLTSQQPINVKGPINIVQTANTNWITAYEHASQDNLDGITSVKEKNEVGLVDGFQGVKGDFEFKLTDDQFKFIGISQTKEADFVAVSTAILRGGYLDGEEIINERPYETVWSYSAFYDGDLEEGKSLIRHYLLNQITEHAKSREPMFYYNTWGMQREEESKGLGTVRGVLNQERIMQEIDNAAQLGVDLFVLDDGWEDEHGIWQPHKEKFPNGLKPFKEKLDGLGIEMGVWFSPLGIDSTTTRYKENKNWVVLDSKGEPVLAQWNKPAFDFVGDFFDVFVEESKLMIDQGVTFFKWDAINSVYSQLPNLHHGSDQYSGEELRARYEYLLPIYIAKAMEELTDYNNDLIIEIDLTEARRVMIGLSSLANGKWFFMNNGATWYNDYSDFRAKSMRTIANEYNGIIPLELFTYANYPQNQDGDQAYNVNNSILAGHGFWGNLNIMTDSERLFVGEQLKKAKMVLPYLIETNVDITGKVGDNPEIYKQINEEESAGQVIVFGRDNEVISEQIAVNEDNFLAVLDQEYTLENGELSFDLKLQENTSTDQAYIIPDKEKAKNTIVSTTTKLKHVESTKNSMTISTAGPGEVVVFLGADFTKKPLVTGKRISVYNVQNVDGKTKVNIQTETATEITIR